MPKTRYLTDAQLTIVGRLCSWPDSSWRLSNEDHYLDSTGGVRIGWGVCTAPKPLGISGAEVG